MMREIGGTFSAGGYIFLMAMALSLIGVVKFFVELLRKK